jgi:hypothetical protein
MGTRLGSLDVGGALDDAHKLLVQQGGVDKQVTVASASASESAKGFAELATTAEAQAGTDDERIITPAKLQDVTATAARAGVAELATQAEVDGGTDATRIVTPDTLLGAPSSAFLRLYHAQEQQATGVDSATALTAAGPAAVARRDFAEVVDTLGVDGGGGGSVGGANNTQITLPAGTYELDARAMMAITATGAGNFIYAHRLEWYNVTDAASVLHGPTFRRTGNGATSVLPLSEVATILGKFTIAATKVFELRHWGDDELSSITTVIGGTHSGTGLGSFGEIYSDVMLRQLAVG